MSALVVCSRLRFLPIAKRVSSFLRSANFRQYNSQHTQLHQKNFVKNVSQISFRCVTSSSSIPVPETSKVDQLSFGLEANLRRFGRVSRNQLKNLLQEIDRQGVPSEHNILLVLRCFGGYLYDEHPDVKVQLAEEFWNKLQNQVTFSTQDYNALLAVYLQNGHKFSPEEFLAKMEASGVKPNRVTFQRLIARYCEQGDIEGANKILSHMKSLDLPINDQVFNSFITGHFRAGDPASANEILNIMAQAGLEPTGDTYGALMCGYAEMGDVEGIQKVVVQAETESVQLRPSHFLDALMALVESGHEKHADMILMILSKKMGFNQDAIVYTNQLLAKGYDDVAYKLFLTMPKPVQLNSQEVSAGRFLLRALAKHQRPVDKVADIVRDMKEMQLNCDDLSAVAQLAFSIQNTDYAMQILDKMKSEGVPVKTHYFWPAICQYRDQKNTDKLIETVTKLKQLVDIPEDMVFTLHQFVIPALVSLKHDPQEFFSKLEAAGYSAEEVNFSHFIYLLSKQKPEEALQFGEDKPMFVVFAALKSEISNLMRNGKLDWRLGFKLVTLCEGKLDKSIAFSDVSGDILWQFLRQNETNPDWTEVEEVLDTMLTNGLFIRRNDILARFLKNAPAHVVEKFESITKDFKGTRTQTLSDKSIDELRSVLDGDTENVAAKKWLLIKACSVGNVSEAEKLQAELDQQGFVYPALVTRQLAFLYSTFSKDFEKAMIYFNQLLSEHPTFNNYSRVVLSISGLLLEQGKAEEAISMLKEHGDKILMVESSDDVTSTFIFKQHCGLLVKAAIKHDVDSAYQVMEALFEHGYSKKDSWEVNDAFVEGLIELGDPDVVLANMTKTFLKDRKVPNIHAVFCMLIQKEDPEKLQKVVDMVTEIHGEMNVLHDLMAAFVDCGDLKKARKILETPGLRARMPRLVFACNRFIREKKLTALENLVNITRDLFDVDRDEMLFHLMRGYVFNGDVDKMLAVLDQFEEENVQPSNRTLLYLARECKKAGKVLPDHLQKQAESLLQQQVQFKPQPRQQQTENVGRPRVEIHLNSVDNEALQFIINNDFEHFESLRKRVEQSENPVKLVNIVKALLMQKKFTDLRGLFRYLGQKGDLESLLLMKNEGLITGRLKLALHPHIVQAYIERDQIPECMQYLRDNVDDMDTHITSFNVRDLAAKSPEHLSEVEEMAVKLADNKNELRPLGAVWSSYYLTDSKKADELLEKYPGLLKHLNSVFVAAVASSLGRADLLTSLLNMHRQHGLKKLPFVYSHLIGVQCANEDTEAVQESLKQLRADGLDVSNLKRKAIVMMEELFTKNNIPVTWDVTPPKRESSSSSDSSSSDDEKKQ
ncbi:leucine-rich PPR motif-containing protein, mitochondrial-like [Gigantopelta aegis]|uniref:leucine-rich PPR motif-containing protein, mitochondrial-like n=1 Tax=Gigantopelta aegis TaxID=1735272 RepID=UPI001B88A0B3|nr:leucine-rich PPR motif-containing protein, mitochondrial-like [Gigantopelta aegis]